MNLCLKKNSIPWMVYTLQNIGIAICPIVLIKALSTSLRNMHAGACTMTLSACTQAGRSGEPCPQDTVPTLSGSPATYWKYFSSTPALSPSRGMLCLTIFVLFTNCLSLSLYGIKFL